MQIIFNYNIIKNKKIKTKNYYLINLLKTLDGKISTISAKILMGNN